MEEQYLVEVAGDSAQYTDNAQMLSIVHHAGIFFCRVGMIYIKRPLWNIEAAAGVGDGKHGNQP